MSTYYKGSLEPLGTFLPIGIETLGYLLPQPGVYIITNFFSGTASMIVSSFTKPFILQVHTDNTEGSAAPQPAESNNRGFCFNFIQKPCIV